MALKVVYLASPYSHPDKDVMQRRFEEVCVVHAELLEKIGDCYAFIGPIAASHSIAQLADLPTNWEFWKAQDEALLSKCDELWVLELDGWDKSIGIKAEVDYAYYDLKIPIRYVQYDPEIEEIIISAEY